MILMNNLPEYEYEHLVFCRCHENTNGMPRDAKCVLVQVELDDYWKDNRANDICHTCSDRIDRPSNSPFQVVHWCNQCNEVMCDKCHQGVKAYPGERIQSLRYMTRDGAEHWSWSGNHRHELSMMNLVSWNKGNNNRRRKTFDELDAEGVTPMLTYPYRAEANIWTRDDINRWESNASRGSGYRQTHRDNRDDRRDRRDYHSGSNDYYKRARR